MSDDESDSALLPEPAMDGVIQTHPLAALVVAALIGALLAKLAF